MVQELFKGYAFIQQLKLLVFLLNRGDKIEGGLSVEVLFFFSSTGNTTYFQKFVEAEFGGENIPVIFNSQQGAQLIVKSKIRVTDTTYGVFSVKGYNSYLAEEVTKRVDRNVEEISTKY